MLFKGIYRYTNPRIREWIRQKRKQFWRFFSLIIVPLGMVVYSLAATWLDRLQGLGTPGNSFYQDLIDSHAISLIFGITFLIAFDIGFFSVDQHDIVKWYKVSSASRGRICTPEEVDAQANAPGSEWLPNIGIILAPEMIIGFCDGLRVVRYEDISKLRVDIRKGRVQVSMFKWVDADALCLYPIGKGIAQIQLAESYEDPEMLEMELDIIREKCQQFHPETPIKFERNGKRQIYGQDDQKGNKQKDKRDGRRDSRQSNNQYNRQKNKRKAGAVKQKANAGKSKK